MKRCNKCLIFKNLSEFSLHKSAPDGLRYECKECHSSYSKKYYELNEQNWVRRSEKNKEHRKIYNKFYCIKNREKINTQKRLKRNKNNEDFSSKRRNYEKKRKQEDLQFRLASNIRSRLCKLVRKEQKIGSLIKDLGCSTGDLKWWLEFWFDEGMNWNNYGYGDDKWNIDHIKPLSKFNLTDRIQFMEVCNYKNLQPMWQPLNLCKSNKYEQI